MQVVHQLLRLYNFLVSQLDSQHLFLLYFLLDIFKSEFLTQFFLLDFSLQKSSNNDEDADRDNIERYTDIINFAWSEPIQILPIILDYIALRYKTFVLWQIVYLKLFGFGTYSAYRISQRGICVVETRRAKEIISLLACVTKRAIK